MRTERDRERESEKDRETYIKMEKGRERESKRERDICRVSMNGSVAVQMTCRWGWCTMFYEEVAPG